MDFGKCGVGASEDPRRYRTSLIDIGYSAVTGNCVKAVLSQHPVSTTPPLDMLGGTKASTTAKPSDAFVIVRLLFAMLY